MKAIAWVLLLSFGLPGCADSGSKSGADESLIGWVIAGNAGKSKTPEGANAANLLGNMLMGRGQAMAGRGEQQVTVNSGVGATGILPARVPHPSWPNVVSDGAGGWEPAPGYKWLTQEPGDPRVIKEQSK